MMANHPVNAMTPIKNLFDAEMDCFMMYRFRQNNYVFFQCENYIKK
jgi:hypothetical protein